MIEYEKQGNFAVFRINNPEALGAMTVKGFEEFHNALVDFRDDDKLLSGIITGTGEKAFCTGVDINDMLPFIKRTATKPWQQYATVLRDMEIWKPIIAACNGLTLGGGLEIALGCDIRIASENARFGCPEVKVGFFPGGGGTQRLLRFIPASMAAEMIFTGKMIDAQEAYRIGLVNRILPLDQLLPAAIEITQAIGENGPLAVRTAKQLMIKGMSLGLEEGIKLEHMMTPTVVFSKDFEEGIKAFLEKRKPEFNGR